MMNQLQASQISVFWPAIKETIRKSSPLLGDQYSVYLNNALEGLLSGKFQCWIMHENVNGKKEMYGVVITSLITNKLYGYNTLYIDHMYAFRQWSKELIQDAFGILEDYATSCDCRDIIADSNNHKAHGIARNLGFEKITTRLQYIL